MASWLKDDGESSFRAVIGKALVRWGAKRETVRGYLEALEWAGFIEVFEKEDRITWVAQ